MHNSKRKQQLTPETIKPGDVFYYFRDKCHFVGTLQDEAVTLYTYWHYNRYARRRVYKTEPKWSFAITLQYSRVKRHTSN